MKMRMRDGTGTIELKFLVEDVDRHGIFGWDSPKQAALYTKSANRKRLTADAMPMVDPDYNSNKSVPLSRPVEAGGTIRGKKAC